MLAKTEDTALSTMSAYQLIEFLDKAVPARCILPNETLESAHRYAGVRDMIDELVSMKNDELVDAAV